MFGILRLLGRSPDLVAPDDALRKAGLHPRTVPEAVNLTTVRLLKEANAGASVPEAAYEDAAQLLGYCIQARDEFISANGSHAADLAEKRLEGAIAAGDSLDAKLVLLTLHSGVIASEVVGRFDLEIG